MINCQFYIFSQIRAVDGTKARVENSIYSHWFSTINDTSLSPARHRTNFCCHCCVTRCGCSGPALHITTSEKTVLMIIHHISWMLTPPPLTVQSNWPKLLIVKIVDSFVGLRVTVSGVQTSQKTIVAEGREGLQPLAIAFTLQTPRLQDTKESADIKTVLMLIHRPPTFNYLGELMNSKWKYLLATQTKTWNL